MALLFFSCDMEKHVTKTNMDFYFDSMNNFPPRPG